MQQARFYLLGESAVVLELSPPVSLQSQQRIWALVAAFAHHPDIREVVPGMNNLTLLLNNAHQTASRVAEQLEKLWDESDSLIITPREVAIPVYYGGIDGPDLDEVARHTGMSSKQVVECHSAADYVVYFIGFQPGFSYMGGLPTVLNTPRRAEPRLSVAAGSVGIGGSQTGIYPLVTPGGWQLIGRTPLSLFDPTSSTPTLLRPGDKVRFVPQKEGVC